MRPLALLLASLLLVQCSAPKVEIVAHRGASAKAPENTLSAFNQAWKDGSDSCELDVYLTADGKTAIIHDKDTQRTAGSKLLIAKSSRAQLDALEVGSWKAPQFRGEKIPTLDQALATLPKGQHRFFIEIKCGPEVIPEITRVLDPMRDRAAQWVIIAFNRETAAAAKKALPWIKVYRLASGKASAKTKTPPTSLQQLIADTKSDGLDGLDLSLDGYPWDKAMLSQVRAAGLGIFVWTVNRPEDLERLIKVGVDGITTDDPALARDIHCKLFGD